MSKRDTPGGPGRAGGQPCSAGDGPTGFDSSKPMPDMIVAARSGFFECGKIECGPCQACCRHRQQVIVKSEWCDDVSAFDTVERDGNRVLRHKDNGDCVYLDRRKGCTIHCRQPNVCKYFDCRFAVVCNVPKIRTEIIQAGVSQLLKLETDWTLIARSAGLRKRCDETPSDELMIVDPEIPRDAWGDGPSRNVLGEQMTRESLAVMQKRADNVAKLHKLLEKPNG